MFFNNEFMLTSLMIHNKGMLNIKVVCIRLSDMFHPDNNLSLKFCQSYEPVECFVEVLDLSKNILQVSLGERATKLWSVKHRG